MRQRKTNKTELECKPDVSFPAVHATMTSAQRRTHSYLFSYEAKHAKPHTDKPRRVRYTGLTRYAGASRLTPTDIHQQTPHKGNINRTKSTQTTANVKNLGSRRSQLSSKVYTQTTSPPPTSSPPLPPPPPHRHQVNPVYYYAIIPPHTPNEQLLADRAALASPVTPRPPPPLP